LLCADSEHNDCGEAREMKTKFDLITLIAPDSNPSNIQLTQINLFGGFTGKDFGYYVT